MTELQHPIPASDLSDGEPQANLCGNSPDCLCENCCERRHRELARETEGYQAAGQLADYINRTMQSPGDFVKGMHRQHRTLQQGFTGLCVEWMEHLARLKDGEYDGRNDASVQLAKRLVKSKAWKDRYLPYI